MPDSITTNPYLRAADRLRKEAELKLQARQAEEQTERARDEKGRFIPDATVSKTPEHPQLLIAPCQDFN